MSLSREQIEAYWKTGEWPRGMIHADFRKMVCDLALAALSGVPQGEQPVHSAPASNAGDTDFQGEWIAVSERLPSGRVQVLFVNLFSGKPIVCLGFKENDDPDSRQWFDMSSTDVDGDYRDCYEVTHWMPLPPPPQARRDEADAQTNEKD